MKPSELSKVTNHRLRSNEVSPKGSESDDTSRDSLPKIVNDYAASDR